MKLRRLGWAAVASAVAVAACGDPVTIEPRFEIVDAWSGMFRGARVGFPVEIVVETENDGRLTGFATGWAGRYDLTGRYTPPTVYFRMTTDSDTLTFLGEMEVAPLVSGILVMDADDEFEQASLLLARR